MYENAGKSIKGVVSIIVKIGYALSIISAVLVVILGLTAGHFGALLLSLVVAAIVGGLGCLCAWLSGLWLYAYGEITDRLISIDEQLSNIKSVAGADTPTATAPKQVTPNYAKASVSTFCTACGARNNPSARYCVACSAELPRVTAKPSGNTWVCPCGRVNAAYVGTCTCGKSKRDAVK